MSKSGEAHPAIRLFEQLRHFGHYPTGVRGIRESGRVRGTAFFPAGNGLWDHDGSLPTLPDRPLMILGHNFGDTAAMDDAVQRGMENMNGATWRNMRRLLADAQVRESRCFFTNALMGLKDDAKGCVGPLSEDPDYRQRCLDFLRFQAEVIQPGCVLALGEDAMQALVKLSSDVRNAWCGPRGGPRTIKNVLLTPSCNPLPSARLSASVRCAVAVLYHPCELRNLRPVWTEAITLVRSAASHCGS